MSVIACIRSRLRRSGGMTIAELAADTGYPVETVRNSVWRAIRGLELAWRMNATGIWTMGPIARRLLQPGRQVRLATHAERAQRQEQREIGAEAVVLSRELGGELEGTGVSVEAEPVGRDRFLVRIALPPGSATRCHELIRRIRCGL